MIFKNDGKISKIFFIFIFTCVTLNLAFAGGALASSERTESGTEKVQTGDEKNVIARGMTYYKNVISENDRKQTTYVLEFDLMKSDFEIESVFGQDCMYKKETVSSMARRKNAIAAVNGAFFSKAGAPLGMLVHQGKIVKEPILGRTVFGVTNDNEFFFDNPRFDARFFYKKKETDKPAYIELDGINRAPGEEEVIIFTSEYGNKTRTSSKTALEITVVDEKVVAIGGCNSLIPPEGYVIHAGGFMAEELEKVCVTDIAYMELYVNPVWEKAKFAVGGGPRLLKDGAVTIEAKAEKFKSDVVSGRAPRTAVGITADKKILMVCVDGRQKNSAGMTLKELARYMKKLGAVDAMNLDGGGSTTFFLMGKVLNSPSDGRERPVSQALVIKPKDGFDKELTAKIGVGGTVK